MRVIVQQASELIKRIISQTKHTGKESDKNKEHKTI